MHNLQLVWREGGMELARIAVGFDGSKPAEKAVAYAAGLAATAKARLLLVYVVEPINAPVDTLPIQDWSGVLERHRAWAEQLLSHMRKGLQEQGTVEVETRVLMGSPAAELARVAEAPDVGLIVVGSSGRGAVARILLGSVASRLVRHCAKPVLVVP